VRKACTVSGNPHLVQKLCIIKRFFPVAVQLSPSSLCFFAINTNPAPAFYLCLHWKVQDHFLNWARREYFFFQKTILKDGMASLGWIKGEIIDRKSGSFCLLVIPTQVEIELVWCRRAQPDQHPKKSLMLMTQRINSSKVAYHGPGSEFRAFNRLSSERFWHAMACILLIWKVILANSLWIRKRLGERYHR